MARRVLEEGWTLTAAAEATGVSVPSARKWVRRTDHGSRARAWVQACASVWLSLLAHRDSELTVGDRARTSSKAGIRSPLARALAFMAKQALWLARCVLLRPGAVVEV